MLGWGLVGVLGAMLARPLSLPRGGRSEALALALACAVGAEMFNLVMDLYTWIGSGTHSLAAFGVVLGAALVFDLTHVGASFAFGFAFGPGLRRILTRVRGRLEVRWEDAPPRPVRALVGLPPASLLLVLCVPLLALGLTACANASKPAPPARDARVAIAARARVPERGAEPRRRLRGRPGPAEQRAVHRVGGDGARGGRAQPGRADP